jgi:hypothetical protein
MANPHKRSSGPGSALGMHISSAMLARLQCAWGILGARTTAFCACCRASRRSPFSSAALPTASSTSAGDIFELALGGVLQDMRARFKTPRTRNTRFLIKVQPEASPTSVVSSVGRSRMVDADTRFPVPRCNSCSGSAISSIRPRSPLGDLVSTGGLLQPCQACRDDSELRNDTSHHVPSLLPSYGRRVLLPR